jgi:hypothetical protein
MSIKKYPNICVYSSKMRINYPLVQISAAEPVKVLPLLVFPLPPRPDALSENYPGIRTGEKELFFLTFLPLLI